METNSLVSLFAFDNEAKLFPVIDHRVKFALLTIAGNSINVNEAIFAFGIHRVGDLKQNERVFSLSARDIELLNPNTRTCPVFHSNRDLELTKTIYSHIPVLIKEGSNESNLWDIKFYDMFHMSNDSHLFQSGQLLGNEGWTINQNNYYKDGEMCLPLYESKMIWHFDHRFGTFEGQTQAQANQGKLPELNEQQHSNPKLLTMPRYWIHESHMPNLMHDDRNALLVFRDITNSVLLRTAIFCILPTVPVGGTLHNCRTGF